MGHVRSKLGGWGHHPWGEFFFAAGGFLEKLPFLPAIPPVGAVNADGHPGVALRARLQGFRCAYGTRFIEEP